MDSNNPTDIQLTDLESKEAKSIATNYLNPVIWAQIKGMAQTFIQSKALPKHIQNTPQAVMILQKGYEMGMKPMESISSLYMVNGLTTIWGKATVGRLRAHGYSIEYLEENSEHCKARVWKNHGGNEKAPLRVEEYTEDFKFSDAEESGWTTGYNGDLKVGWRKGQNRKLKMRYGVLSSIIKSYIPDVLGSANDIEEVAQDYRTVEIEEISDEEFEKGKALHGPGELDSPEHKSLQESLVVKNKMIDDLAENPAIKDKLRKEFFAIANEAGVDSEAAKANIKGIYKVESFNDISVPNLKLYIKTMRMKLKSKQALEAKGKAKKKAKDPVEDKKEAETVEEEKGAKDGK